MMANPRKFSEKIALHNQKQAEETAAFERIMQEVSVTRVVNPGMQQPLSANQLLPHPQGFLRPYLGGSLPNVNQIAANPNMGYYAPPQVAGFDDGKHLMRHPGRFDSRMRPYAYNHRRPLPLELNRGRMAPLDGPSGQFTGPYLSPPPESNWRRTHSDSALHKSVMNPASQQPFNATNPMHMQGRLESPENNFALYKAVMEGKKLDSHLQGGNRPKSCDAPNMSHHPSAESPVVRPSGEPPFQGNGVGNRAPGAMDHGLSHVTQIGNNTGSLPDLSNLHIPSPLIKPIDYEDMPSSTQQSGSQTSPLYNQSRNPSTAISSHVQGMSRGPASPGRGRRSTQNGRSPLTLNTSDLGRRMKYANQALPKGAATQAEIKSPPAAGTYTQVGTPGGGWPLPSPDHAGSPTYGQTMSPHGIKQAEFTTRSNPALSEACYTSDMTSSMQPLQYQFEQFHVVSDTSSPQHHSMAPPVYSALATLNETMDGVYDQGHSGSISYGGPDNHFHLSNHMTKIPDIVLTGADDPHSNKSAASFLNEFSGLGGEYFSGADLKANLGLEELQMLDESNIINDPPLEESLHLDSM